MTLSTSAAWRAFASSVADAGAALEVSGLELDELDRAEGLRYLARLIENGVAAQLGDDSPTHPAFRLLSNGFGMDNPDNHYLGSPVDPRFTYRITGTKATLSYLSLAAQNQNFANAETITGGAGHLHADELWLDPDGRFTVLASHAPQPGNWLRLAEDSRMVLVRQTRADPAVEHWAEIAIQCLDHEEPPPPLDPTRLKDRLNMVGLYAGGAAAWFVDWVRPWLERPNTFAFADPDEQQRLGGDPNIVAQSAYWNLADDETLVIEFTPPDCAYWNVQLANIWAECLDTRRQVWRNSANAVAEPDGMVRLVVAHRDPGVANWLDTAGHRHGTAHVRYVLSGSQPAVRTSVVPYDQVAMTSGARQA